jgi:hypothetical protein
MKKMELRKKLQNELHELEKKLSDLTLEIRGQQDHDADWENPGISEAETRRILFLRKVHEIKRKMKTLT